MKVSFGSMRQWHWVSAAICIVGMLFFSWTGITLNHAADIKSRVNITTIESLVPAVLIAPLSMNVAGKTKLPHAIRQHLSDKHALNIPPVLSGELNDGEFYMSMPQAGVDAWLAIDLLSGELMYEKTDRGWISFFNDLHKGRYTNIAWRWFLDAFAVTTIVFCLSGFWLLLKQASFRLSTWPIVGFGVLLPSIIILASAH